MKPIRIAFWQANPTVGDIDGNLERLVQKAIHLREKVDLIVTPECYLTGYPIQDLALRRGFIVQVRRALDRLSEIVSRDDLPAILVGAPEEGTVLPHNSMFLVDNDGSLSVTRKHHLANSEVYDEVRTFAPGPLPKPLSFRGWNLGVPICEDVWHGDVVAYLVQEGAHIILCPNGSHFKMGKQNRRRAIGRNVTLQYGIPFTYLNLVGGQDEIVFDGGSYSLDHHGHLIHETAFEDNTFILEYRRVNNEVQVRFVEDVEGESELRFLNVYPHSQMESLHAALTMGLRDYVNKSGFPGVIIGMSGGVDSALAAALAVDALGADRVTLVRMPSRHTSQESMELAELAAERLGVEKLLTISIEDVVSNLETALKTTVDIRGITAENLQARARGVILMGLSNATGHMVLSTGNKSEMTVGYATLYGDMCGGFNVLKGLWKTDVFALSEWRNKNSGWKHSLGPKGVEVIPQGILSRPPSAELAEGQTDEASLGSYDVLDTVLRLLVSSQMPAHLAAREASKRLGHEVSLDYVNRVARMAWRSEYKRRQAAPGLVVGEGDYDKDWRMPMVNAAGLA